jgi:hypothetical protein
VEIAGKVLLDSKTMEILLRVLYIIREKLESQTSIHLIFWHKRSLRIIIQPINLTHRQDHITIETLQPQNALLG